MNLLQTHVNYQTFGLVRLNLKSSEEMGLTVSRLSVEGLFVSKLLRDLAIFGQKYMKPCPSKCARRLMLHGKFERNKSELHGNGAVLACLMLVLCGEEGAANTLMPLQ